MWRAGGECPACPWIQCAIGPLRRSRRASARWGGLVCVGYGTSESTRAKRCGRRSLGLDGDAARAGFLGLGQRQEQQPVLQLRLNLVGVHRGGQLHQTLEATLAALTPVPAALGRLLRFLLALDEQL